MLQQQSKQSGLHTLLLSCKYNSFQGKTRVSHLYSEVTKSHPCQTLTPSELTLGFGEDDIPKLSSLKQQVTLPDLWSPVLAPALGSMLRSTNTLEYQIKLVVVHYDCIQCRKSNYMKYSYTSTSLIFD